MKKIALPLLTLLACIVVSGCADNVTFIEATKMHPVGFWYGLWHGMIAPISWLFSLFSDNISMYAIYNNGGWYNLGFLFGIGTWGVSPSVSVKYIRVTN